VETIHSAEEKKRHAIAKVTKKLKQDQDIALDVLSVSIELHTKKEERLTRSLDYLNDTLLL
jgi:hemerythrin